MAWKNLQEELGELFDRLSSRAEEMAEALDERRARRHAYQLEWGRQPHARKAHAAARRRRRKEDAVWAEEQRVKARARMARRRQRLIVPITSTPSIAPAS